MPYAGDDGKSPDEMDLEDKLKELADLLEIPPVEFGKFGPTQRGLAAVTEAIRRTKETSDTP
jgi:hypothetical protein